MMTKEEYLKLAEERYEAIACLKEEQSFYDYEKKFDQLWTGLGRAVLEQSIGKPSGDKRKKKL